MSKYRYLIGSLLLVALSAPAWAAGGLSPMGLALGQATLQDVAKFASQTKNPFGQSNDIIRRSKEYGHCSSSFPPGYVCVKFGIDGGYRASPPILPQHVSHVTFDFNNNLLEGVTMIFPAKYWGSISTALKEKYQGHLISQTQKSETEDGPDEKLTFKVGPDTLVANRYEYRVYLHYRTNGFIEAQKQHERQGINKQKQKL